jgi:hypothetical protein
VIRAVYLCLFSVFILSGCQRNNSVHASNEPDYAPRPSQEKKNTEMKGELIHVDKKGRKIAIRVENGMVQTFRTEPTTVVTGLNNQQESKTVRDLLGKEGSEVTVQWIEQDELKAARSIEVTQVVSVKRRGRRR